MARVIEMYRCCNFAPFCKPSNNTHNMSFQCSAVCCLGFVIVLLVFWGGGGVVAGIDI